VGGIVTSSLTKFSKSAHFVSNSSFSKLAESAERKYGKGEEKANERERRKKNERGMERGKRAIIASSRLLAKIKYPRFSVKRFHGISSQL
jgi:hypothetical protein